MELFYQKRRCQARQTTFLSYFGKKYEELPTDTKTTDDDPVDPDDPQLGNSYHE
jgi:hypothetical protein